MKFLKREKKDNFDELDLPPVPPSLDTGEFGADFDKGMELPEIPDFPEEKISAPEQKFDFENDVPSELQPEPEVEEQQVPETASARMPQSQEPMQPKVQIASEEPRFAPPDDYTKVERRVFAEEKKALRERPAGKVIYVKVDKFKAALGSISVVRGDLRKSEEALMKLESIKASKDRSFDRVRSSLDDLQKKLIFIDKTLFKED